MTALVAAFRARRAGGPWGPTLAVGVAHLVASAVALALPAATLVAVVWLFAAWSVVIGAMLAAAALRARRTAGRWWRVAGGALSVVWGLLLVIAPFAGALVMTIWLGAYALAVGVGLLTMAWRRRRGSQRTNGAARAPA